MKDDEYEQFLEDSAKESDRIKLILEFHSELVFKDTMLPSLFMPGKPTMQKKERMRIRLPMPKKSNSVF